MSEFVIVRGERTDDDGVVVGSLFQVKVKEGRAELRRSVFYG